MDGELTRSDQEEINQTRRMTINTDLSRLRPVTVAASRTYHPTAVEYEFLLKC